MRLLFTAFTFPPQANGVAEVVARQAHGLAARGHEVTVATAHDDARAAAPGANPRVEQFRLSGAESDPTEEVARYRAFIATFPCDAIVLHCWRCWTTDLAAPVLAQNPARKIFVSHGYDWHRWHPLPRFPWGLGNWLRGLPYLAKSARLLGAIDRIVFLAPRQDFGRFFDHWCVARLGWPGRAVIPNGADPARFAGAQRDFREHHGIGAQPMLLYVASYVPSKGQDIALRAFLRAAPAATLVFIGHRFTPFTEALRSIAAGAPPQSRVLFLEDSGPATVAAAYVAADLVVLSSRGETQPLVLLDGMAAGKPFLSTDVGGVRDLAGGVVVRDEAELAREMAALVADPARRAGLGAAGRAACDAIYSWPRVLDAYEALLAKLVPTPPTRRE